MQNGQRWAVVTGASRGIGAAIARRLAADGFGVSLLATKADLLNDMRDEIRAGGGQAEVVVCDLTDREQLAAVCAGLTESHPAIHALVNNAGIVRVGDIADFDGADWDDVMEINVRAAFELVRALEPALRAAAGAPGGDSSVVNVSSVMGLVACKTIISYLAAKGALNHLTRGLALELGAAGVRVNAVAPGYIRTDMFETSHSPERQVLLGKSHALERVGTPEEVAGVVSFLCSSDSTFVSGTVISVDGGLHARAAIPEH